MISKYYFMILGKTGKRAEDDRVIHRIWYDRCGHTIPSRLEYSSTYHEFYELPVPIRYRVVGRGIMQNVKEREKLVKKAKKKRMFYIGGKVEGYRYE